MFRVEVQTRISPSCSESEVVLDGIGSKAELKKTVFTTFTTVYAYIRSPEFRLGYSRDTDSSNRRSIWMSSGSIQDLLGSQSSVDLQLWGPEPLVLSVKTSDKSKNDPEDAWDEVEDDFEVAWEEEDEDEDEHVPCVNTQMDIKLWGPGPLMVKVSDFEIEPLNPQGEEAEGWYRLRRCLQEMSHAAEKNLDPRDPFGTRSAFMENLDLQRNIAESTAFLKNTMASPTSGLAIALTKIKVRRAEAATREAPPETNKTSGG